MCQHLPQFSWSFLLPLRHCGCWDFPSHPEHLQCQSQKVLSYHLLPVQFRHWILPVVKVAGGRPAVDSRESQAKVWAARVGPHWHHALCQPPQESGDPLWLGSGSQLQHVPGELQGQTEQVVPISPQLHRGLPRPPAPLWLFETPLTNRAGLLCPVLLQECSGAPGICQPHPLLPRLGAGPAQQEDFVKGYGVFRIESQWLCQGLRMVRAFCQPIVRPEGLEPAQAAPLPPLQF